MGKKEFAEVYQEDQHATDQTTEDEEVSEDQRDD